MLRRLSLLFFILVFAQSAWAAPKTPISLAKTTKWEINYDEAACHLLARFGTGNEEISIRMSRYGPSDAFFVTLFGNIFATKQAIRPLEIDFGLARPNQRDAVAGTIGNGLPMLLLGSARLDGWEENDPLELPPVITKEQEAKATAINLKLPGGKRFRLETGPLNVPMAAMRKCVDDLVLTWGFDPVQQATLKKPAAPLSSPGPWFGSSDYPLGAVHRGENGIVQFRLNIGKEGEIEECHIAYRTKPDKFADLTCKILSERGKFRPALDAQGNPIRSFYVNAVRWLASR